MRNGEGRAATGESPAPGAHDAAQAAPPQDSDDLARLRTELAEAEARLRQAEARLRQALADFDNLRKRTAREAARQREDERARVAASWLPVLDNLELALQHAAADPGSIVSGVQAVHEQALSVLAELGYPRRSDLHEPFDPSRHEAVAAVPDPQAAPGTILQVIRPGYGSDERPLRPAAVVVAKGD